LDIDDDALQIAKKNCSESVDVEFILTDIVSNSMNHIQNKVDTIVMNPPFGTKYYNNGIDMIFLKKAIEVYLKTFSICSISSSSIGRYLLS
jgi:predicted RNA methylase